MKPQAATPPFCMSLLHLHHIVIVKTMLLTQAVCSCKALHAEVPLCSIHFMSLCCHTLAAFDEGIGILPFYKGATQIPAQRCILKKVAVPAP